MKMYQEDLMDHYQHPRYRKKLECFDFESHQVNPLCGDVITMQAVINDNKIVDIGFGGNGCVVSQATASKLCVYVLNKSLNELQALTADDIMQLIHLSLGPTRIKCALLALYALKDGITMYQKRM